MSRGMHFRTPGEAEQWAKQMEPHWKSAHKKYGGTYTPPTIRQNKYGMYEFGGSNQASSTGGVYSPKPQPGGQYSEVAPPVHSPGYAAWLANWKQQGAGNQGGFSAYSPGSAQPRQNPYAYSHSYGSSSQGAPPSGYSDASSQETRYRPGQAYANPRGKEMADRFQQKHEAGQTPMTRGPESLAHQYWYGGNQAQAKPSSSGRPQATRPTPNQSAGGAATPGTQYSDEWIARENARRRAEYENSPERRRQVESGFIVADAGPGEIYRGKDGQLYVHGNMLPKMETPKYRYFPEGQPDSNAGQPSDPTAPQIALTPPGAGGGVSGQGAGGSATPGTQYSDEWIQQENERRSEEYRSRREEEKRLGQPMHSEGGGPMLYRGEDGQVYEQHPMLPRTPGWEQYATLYGGPEQTATNSTIPANEPSGPPRPPQPTGFQTSWGGSPQPFFGGQFGGFQQPFFGGGQFGGFQQPFFGGGQFGGFQQPFFGGGQFGGFQQPSFGGGQFLMSLLQGLYPGFR